MKAAPQLKLRNVACPGETSRSLITGERSPCHYDSGSQLDAAVEYIDAHPGQVELITLDVGANDLLNRCMRWKTGLIDRQCTKEQRPRLKSRLKQIVDTLSMEVGPGVPIVAMTYYNPFLGFWGHVPGGRALARADQRAWVTFNAGHQERIPALGCGSGDTSTRHSVSKTSNTPEFCQGLAVFLSMLRWPVRGPGSVHTDSSWTRTLIARAT